MSNSISGSAGVAGATVVLTDFAASSFASTTADGSGNYTFAGLAAGDYFIAAGLTGYVFAPASAKLTIVSTNLTQNFTATAFVPTGVWTKYGDVNLITPGNGIGSISGTGTGTVLLEGSPQLIVAPPSGKVFKAWYMDGVATRYAESADGVSWTIQSGNLVDSLSNPNVKLIAGTYYLTGTATNPGSISIYTAATSNGPFTVLNASAVVAGAAGQWDSGGCFQLQIVDQVAGTWRGIYTGISASLTGAVSIISLGLVTSTDLHTWTKSLSSPVFYTASSPEIHKVGSIYYMWYNGVPYDQAVGLASSLYGPTDIWRAQSTDLITWTNAQPSLNRSFIGEGPGKTQGAIVNPSLVVGDNSVYMFYLGTNHAIQGQNFKFMLATASIGIAALVASNEGLLASPQLAIDTFQRANENPLSDGGNWTNLGNNFQLLNNQAVPSATTVFCDATYSGVVWPASQYNEAELDTGAGAGPFFDLIARFNGVADYNLQMHAGLTTGLITLSVAGTPVATTTITLVPLDVIRIEAIILGADTRINVYQNGTNVLTYLDSPTAIAAGNPYIQARNDSAVADTAYGAWEGGSPIPAALPPVPIPPVPPSGHHTIGHIGPKFWDWGTPGIGSPATSIVGTNIRTRILG